MPVKKIKSKTYLEFLSKKKCPVTGKSSIDIHHESLLVGYKGGLKNHNDFQALPLDKTLHLYERHSSGREEFWSKYRMNPYELAEALLSEYLETGPPDADLAMLYLNRLSEQKDSWNFPVNQRYKTI